MPTTPIGIPKLKKATGERSKGVFTANVEWEAKVAISSNVFDMLPTAVFEAFGDYFPREGYSYPGLPSCTCRKINCETTDKSGIYSIKAAYSDENAGEKGEKPTDDNPLLDRPIIKPVAGMTSKAMTRDRDNKAILNSAGDPIIQSMEDNTIGFQIQANIASVPLWILDLRNTCNAGGIIVAGLPIPPEMARFVLPSGWLSELKNRNGISYYEFSFELLIDERDRHWGYPMDAGFRAIKAVEDKDGIPRDKLTAILEDDGSEPSDPVPLDGEGRRLEDPTPETTVFRIVKKYATADYSVLPGVN